jgi:hypothetical protein
MPPFVYGDSIFTVQAHPEFIQRLRGRDDRRSAARGLVPEALLDAARANVETLRSTIP